MTLERRLKEPMGPSPSLGAEHEKRLNNHIKVMQSRGFPLTIDDLRKIAFKFAEQLGVKHRFNMSTAMIGCRCF